MTPDHREPPSELEEESLRQLNAMVENIGVKRFAMSLGISARQVNRILSGAQPNPIHRMVLCLNAVEPEIGDAALDFVCQELGGHFVRQLNREESMSQAVRECAEAIAAMSDGSLDDEDVREIREAISALSSVLENAPGTEGRG